MNWLSTLWSLIQPVRTSGRPRSVGICGDVSPTIVLSSGPSCGPPCTLPAGHGGWHRNDEGTGWSGWRHPARPLLWDDPTPDECRYCAETAAENARLRQEVTARDWLAHPLHRTAYEAARLAVEELAKRDYDDVPDPPEVTK